MIAILTSALTWVLTQCLSTSTVVCLPTHRFVSPPAAFSMSWRANLRGEDSVTPMRSPLPVITTARAQVKGVFDMVGDSTAGIIRTPTHQTGKAFKALTGCSRRPRRDASARPTHAQSDSCSSAASEDSEDAVAAPPHTPDCRVPATPGAPPSSLCQGHAADSAVAVSPDLRTTGAATGFASAASALSHGQYVAACPLALPACWPGGWGSLHPSS